MRVKCGSVFALCPQSAASLNHASLGDHLLRLLAALLSFLTEAFYIDLGHGHQDNATRGDGALIFSMWIRPSSK
jgi:hypothetical protein